MRCLLTNEYWFPGSWFGIQRHIYKVCLGSWLIIVYNCGVGRMIFFLFINTSWLRCLSSSRGHNTHTHLVLKGPFLSLVASNLFICTQLITEDGATQTHSDDKKMNVCFCFYLSYVAKYENNTNPLSVHTC